MTKEEIDKIVMNHLMHGALVPGYADKILSAIEGERCVWTRLDSGGLDWSTECGQQKLGYNLESFKDRSPFCPCCGKRIEIK